jgi:hypothetical protein
MILSKPLVPKSADGVLRVLLPGRVSTPMQDLANIDATQHDSETWLRSVYKGPIEFHRVGEQASGWLVNRPSMAFANDFIKSGLCDLVLVDEYREIYRNPKLQWEFIQDCEDYETRLIARRDGIDTANEDWEYPMHLACLRHGLTVPETRGRIKRTATYSFSKSGMVMKVRFGYQKLTKEEAASGNFGPVGLRIAKVDKWTPVVKEIHRRILAGYSDVMVADWLNAEGVPAPPYATSGKWSGQLVRELMTDPILSGQRAFRKTISKLVYGRGEHRSKPNPSPLQDEKCEGLAHLAVEEHEELLRYYCQRKARNRGTQKTGRDSGTDEATFHRVFGGCDWAVMAILGRTGNTYARLRFNAGPGGSLILPVGVDWAAWPHVSPHLAGGVTEWAWEYHDLVEELVGSAWLESAVRMVCRGPSNPEGIATTIAPVDGEYSPRRIAEMTDAEFAHFDSGGTIGPLHDPTFGEVDPITGDVHDFEDVEFEGIDPFR